jgi:NAD(P)-dependent dehydrogenase (short-subunit alcohol dehydrogenase family)
VSVTIPNRFAARTAVVTGAGAGIGRATALRLAREGARVVVSDIAEDRLASLVEEDAGLALHPVGGDIASADGVAAVVGAAGGRIDVLVNNVGIMDGFLPPGELDDATWERVLAVNLTATMRMTRAVLPLMLGAGRGAIVNVSSEAGFRASASGVAYAASKAAVNSLTRSTALFYRQQGIRCNAVAPGPVATSIEAPWRSTLAGQVLGPIMQATIPPIATPEELAAAITWLASDEASNVNGVIMACDGGWSAL